MSGGVLGSVVNLVRGFPSHCGKPIGFSIVAALSMPRSEGEKGEVTFFFCCGVAAALLLPFSPFPPAGDPRRSGFSFWYFFFCEVVI